jgi:hypothetical protein
MPKNRPASVQYATHPNTVSQRSRGTLLGSKIRKIRARSQKREPKEWTEAGSVSGYIPSGLAE